MKVKGNKSKTKYECPHCKGSDFIFIGLQRQKGLFNNHELWNCKNCHSTFARESIEVYKSVENEAFNKRASSFYGGFRFSC